MAGCEKLKGQTASKRDNNQSTVNLALSSQSVTQIGLDQLVPMGKRLAPTNQPDTVTNSKTC